MTSAAGKAKAQFFYDIQRLRIATGNRISRAIEFDNAYLTEEDKVFFDATTDAMMKLEKQALVEANRVVSASSVYPWLCDIKGVGPTMAMVLISQFDIRKAERPSQFWSFAGLGVKNGASPRNEFGEKARFNGWLRTKMFVLGDLFIKHRTPKYREAYEDRKNRRQNQFGPCMRCSVCVQGYSYLDENGKARAKSRKNQPKCPECGMVRLSVPEKCENCGGETVGPWGQSDGHRHHDALRCAVKLFLVDFWVAWREAEGLEVCGTYHEEVLGHKHHGEGSNPARPPADTEKRTGGGDE